MKSVNPHNDELIKEYSPHSKEELERIINDVYKTNESWSNTNFAHRAKLMKKVAKILKEQKEEFARLMAEEMGKPIKEGISESEKCSWVCDFYAENAASFLEKRKMESDAKESYVRFDPLGTVLAIMPWNFPFWQVFRFAAPALMAGNTGVLKHSSNVTGCALAIEKIFRDAGLPENAFRTLLVPGSETKEVIQNPKIAAVTLTGSTPAGMATAQAAGEKLKKHVLELGGSDPYIVFEDADIDNAVEKISKSRTINSGQSCIAAKRFIIQESVLSEFSDKLLAKFKEIKMGDPRDENTDIGPQAKKKLRDELHEQVVKSVQKGARVLCGGEVPEGAGAYYPPTLLSEVKKGMPAYEEEMFGPVGAIMSFKDDDEALSIANDTEFGLGSAIFTKNEERIKRFTKGIQAGSVFVNEFVKSDPRLPFGGIKQSGHGRELSDYGIREFVNIKTVSIN